MIISTPAIRSALHVIDPAAALQRIDALSRRAFALHAMWPDGKAARLILLTHSENDRRRNSKMANDEFRLLQTLQRADLPVAQPLHLCTAHDPPFFITDGLQGSSRFEPQDLARYCGQLADALSAIHALDLSRHDLSFLPAQAARIAASLLTTGHEFASIAAAMRSAHRFIRANPPVLLHGDFWPGNLLWQGEKLAGVIDWEDAMLGDPLGDLGKSRLEILWALGYEAMEIYTARYLARGAQLDTSALPYWDLWGAQRLQHFASFAADAEQAARWQAQYSQFVDNAIAALELLQE